MLITRLLENNRGSVAPLFALAIVPILGTIGAAVDYSRAGAARSSMQAAVDATALAMAKEATGLSASQLQTKATAHFNALFTRTDVSGATVTATYSSTNGSQVVVSGNGAITTSFLGVLGIHSVDIGSSSTVKWGSSRLRVALALDNTGSMSSSGKMSALKTATKNLLSQLKSAATVAGDVYVSIVPFSRDVNVGASNYTQNWIDWTTWNTQNGSYSGGSGGGCNGWGWGGGGCNGNGWGNNGGHGGGSSGTWTPANHNTWNGCIMDRAQDYDTKNTTPTTSNTSTLFPAEQYSSCPVAMMGLSYDWPALNAKVDSMYPAGNTNITIGLAWGWQSLTAGAPLNAPAEDPNYQYQKVIILLTDGQNTQNRFGSSQSAIDARTKKACDNIKAAGAVIYTVLVMQGNQSLLQQCASDSSKYFYLTSASQLVAAFNQIGTSLSKMRIAK